MKPEFLINAACFRGCFGIDDCEAAKEEALWTNTVLPQTVARACLMTNTPWGQVSSTSIFSGAKVVENGRLRIEKNLNLLELRKLYDANPESFYGFEEMDTPNFSFRDPPCNFYSGSKALAEESIREIGVNYIWRFGDTFSEDQEPGNLLFRLLADAKICDGLGSISHLGESVCACLKLWDSRAAFGTYNIVNSGAVSTRQIVKLIQEVLQLDHDFKIWTDSEYYHDGAHAVRSYAILSVSKLLVSGIRMRPVEVALRESLNRWRATVPSLSVASKLKADVSRRILAHT